MRMRYLTLLFSLLAALLSSSHGQSYQGINDWTNAYGVVYPKAWPIHYYTTDLDSLWVEPTFRTVVSTEHNSVTLTNIYDTIESWDLETIRTGIQYSAVIHNDGGTDEFTEEFGVVGSSEYTLSNGLFSPLWTNKTDRTTMNVSRFVARKEGDIEYGIDVSPGLSLLYPYRATMRYMSFESSKLYYDDLDTVYTIEFGDNHFSLTNTVSVTENWTLTVLGQVPNTLHSMIGVWQCVDPLAGALSGNTMYNYYANYNPLNYITANSEMINESGSDINPLVAKMYSLADLSDPLAFQIDFDGNAGYTIGGGAVQLTDEAEANGAVFDAVHLDSLDGGSDWIDVHIPAGTLEAGALYEAAHVYKNAKSIEYEGSSGGLKDSLNGNDWDRMRTKFQWFVGDSEESIYRIEANPGNKYIETTRSIVSLRIYKIDPRRAVYTAEGYDGDGVYERNPSCFASDLDLTPASPWNSEYGNLRAGVLISPRHILMARHFKIGVGETIDFVSMDNEVVTRTITANYSLPYFWMEDIEPADSFDSTIYEDYTVGVLDSDVPSDKISFCKVLPKKFWEYLPAGMYGIPMLRFDKSECVTINVGAGVGQQSPIWHPSHLPHSNTGSEAWPDYGVVSTFSYRADDPYKQISMGVVGDSGNPVIAYFKDLESGEYEPVLTQLTSSIGTTTFSPSISIYYDLINEVMAYPDGGGHQLTPIDLSQYGTEKSHAKEY